MDLRIRVKGSYFCLTVNGSIRPTADGQAHSGKPTLSRVSVASGIGREESQLSIKIEVEVLG